MKAYIAIKYHPDHRNKAQVAAISETLESCGLETICVARDVEQWGRNAYEPTALMQKTFEVIQSCNLVVVDLTEKGVGLGIEAGYAHATGIPVVTIARSGSDISQTLAGISRDMWFYEKIEDLRPRFKSMMVCEEKNG